MGACGGSCAAAVHVPVLDQLSLSHNFTAGWPGTNDKAPHSSYLSSLRSDVYTHGVFPKKLK